VRIDGDRMIVRAIAERDRAGARLLADLTRWTPDGATVTSPIEVRRM
jgi:hypothetical protein